MVIQKEIALDLLEALEQIKEPMTRISVHQPFDETIEEFEAAGKEYRQHIQLFINEGFVLTKEENGRRYYYGLTLSGQKFLDDLRYPRWKKKLQNHLGHRIHTRYPLWSNRGHANVCFFVLGVIFLSLLSLSFLA
jgi:hypothetical protein